MAKVVGFEARLGRVGLLLALVGGLGCGGSSAATSGSTGGTTGSGDAGGVVVPADPCSVNHGGCDPNATCTAIAPGESACGCKPGYAGDGRTCTAIDACAVGNGGCDANATCASTGPGTASCTCKVHFAGDGGSCAPIDGCANENGGCDANATCTPTGPETVTCACNAGYGGDGGSCAALDACAVADGGTSPCGPGAICQSTGPGTFSCSCDTGFLGDDAGNCAPIDACGQMDGGGCSAGAICQDTGPGTSTCVCDTGYAADGGSCIAINPCDTDNGGCDPRATCTNTAPGVATCTCPAGMVGGTTCYLPGALLIDDGAKTVNTGTVTLQLQPPGNLLQNGNLASGDLTNWTALYQLGNGAVVTPSGLFSGNRWVTSYDWDVRSQEVDLLAAGYTTAQLDGTSPPVFTVVDWARGNWPNYGDRFQLHAELRDANHSPIATQDDGTAASPYILSDSWTPRSLSFSGYPAGARYLEIVDASKDAEYWAGNYGGQMSDSYAGSPEFSVQLSNDGVTWSDPQQWSPEIDWTLADNGSAVVLARFLDAKGTIIQTVAATIGNCPDGYTWSGDSCLDDQECEDGLARCDPNANCSDVEGSYSCACKVGYSGSGASCTAMTQCGANACDPNATCANTSASTYSCTCNSGYTGDGKSCSPVNACNTAPGTQPVCPTNATCTDTGPGTYSCACNSGYVALGTKVCAPTDPCTTANPCDANATCINPAPGAALCRCNTGYTGNGRTCAEVNPCFFPGYCSGGTCTHTGPDTATCACPANTVLIGNRCASMAAVRLFNGLSPIPPGNTSVWLLPFNNLLVNSDNSNGLNGWTSSNGFGTTPIVSSAAGLFSGKAVVGSWQWTTRSQTINLLASGFNAQQIADGTNLLAQDCFEGTGPNLADSVYFTVELLDPTQHVLKTVSAGDATNPMKANGNWFCKGVLVPLQWPSVSVRFTEATKDAENWAGNYGAATSNAYLGQVSEYELSPNSGASWSPLYTFPNTHYAPNLAPGNASISARFSYDNGANFISPIVSESVTVQ